MSFKFNEQWTPRERIELLVNVLQGQHPDLVGFLVHIIQEQRLAPQWTNIALPQGRSMRECQLMFDSLLQRRPPQHSFPALAPQLSASFPPTLAQPRPHAEQAVFQAQPAPRPIQPRPSRSTDSPIPASTNGEGLTIVRTVGPELGGDRRKKRGRPTKEEVEERTALLAAEGKVYEPKKRPSKKFRASTGTPIHVSERTPTSPTLQTPLLQAAEVREDSSSGKRRSKRQSSLIGAQADEPISPTTRPVDERAAESPSDRLLARYGTAEREPHRIPHPHPTTGPPF